MALLIGWTLFPLEAMAQSRLKPCPIDPADYWDNCLGTFVGGRFGGKYVGEFHDNKKNGRGVETFANGSKYVGGFKANFASGQGTLTYANGSKYVGQFWEGKQNGHGVLRDANGSIISSGIWDDGKFVGSGADQETVQMEQSGGVYVVAARFNDAITLNGVIDSGAADVSIPADIVSTLMRTRTITNEDFLGKQTYVLADGSRVPSQQFLIRSIKVGNKTAENVIGSVASAKGEILIGQSFLKKFKSWSVDNELHSIILR